METLPRLFLALASCITTVTGDPDKFKDLLSALFKYDWSGGCLARAAFVNLLAHLVSAKSTFLHPTLQMLARSLAAPGPEQQQQQQQQRQADHEQHQVENDENNDDTNAARKSSIHEALKTVLTLVPAGVPELYPALADAFPHRRIEGSGSVVNYARQLLFLVSEYAFTLGSNGGMGLVPKGSSSSSSNGSSSSSSSSNGGNGSGATLRDKVLGLIIERCLEIDVEIKIEDSGEATVEDEEDAAEAAAAAATAAHLAHDPSAALVLSENVYVEDPNFILHSHHHPAAAAATAAAAAAAEEEQRQKQEEEEEEEGEEGEEDEVDEMAEKLDSVMLLLFEHLDRMVGREGGEEGGDACAAQLFEGLAPTLEGPILATHRCKYVQFVLFYLAARDPTRRVPSLLVDRLLTRALREENAQIGARQAGLAYLSSFLVRSRAFSVEGIVRALTVLVEAAEMYLARSASDLNIMMLVAKHEEEEGGEEGCGYGWGAVKKEEDGENEGIYEEGREEEGETGRHVLFYSICQAVFYVVGFHHSTLDGEDVLGVGPGAAAAAAAAAAVDSKDGMFISPCPSPLAQQLGLKTRLGRLACSPLRPLDHCLESVKREFLRLAHLHAFVPAGALVGLGWEGGGEEEVVVRNNHNPLDSYFPFDPYLLRRSSRFVAMPDVYRYWQAQQAHQQQQQQLQQQLQLQGLKTVKKEEGEEEEGEEGGEGRSITSEDGHSSGSSVSGSEGEDDDEEGEEDEDDDNSSNSSSSSSRSSSSDEEEEHDEHEGGEEGGGEGEAEEDDDVVSMSVASTGNDLALATAAAAYWRQQQTYAYTGEKHMERRRKEKKREEKKKGKKGGKDGGRKSSHSRKRERVDSMDFDEDGFGQEEEDEDEGEDGTDDEEGERASAATVAATARTGLLLSDHVIEAAAVAAAVERVRKESVSSVGSW